MKLQPTKHGFEIFSDKGTLLGEFRCACGSRKGDGCEWAVVQIQNASKNKIVDITLQPRKFTVSKVREMKK